MDGYASRYPHCYTMKSIRDGSFFVKSKLPLYKWLLLIQVCMDREHPVCDAADTADLSEKIPIQIYQFSGMSAVPNFFKLHISLGVQV